MSEKKTDLVTILSNVVTNINYKGAILLFIVGIIIYSDLFIHNVLSKIPNASSGDTVYTKGSMIQLIIMILSFIVIDLLTNYQSESLL